MTFRSIAIMGVVLLGAIAASASALPSLLPTTYDSAVAVLPKTATTTKPAEVPKVIPDTRPVVLHVPLPNAVKSIYMTACVAGTPTFRDKLVALIERTEINAVIIDIKDYSGTISFLPKDPELLPAWQQAQCGARDMQEFIASLHKKGIYVMGRISVFQDPLRTKSHPELAVKKASDGTVWRDHKGLSFIEVSAKPHWDYIISLGAESYNIGFDELNFDYVRFPSDGNMQDIAFPFTGTTSKPEALERFFMYLHSALSDPERYASVKHEGTGRATTTPYLSADLFGMTATNVDDLSIGQVLERALPYFDFVAPMVYPSHYPKTFLGLGNPNSNPYKVVNYAMASAVRRASATTTSVVALTHERIGTSTPALYAKPAYDIQKLRPWLQDFDYGGDYGPVEVRAQIQATYDTGLTSFMLWAPTNLYTEGALEKE